ncbi:MAG: VOC family protein [Nibricoccus sp.]
MKITEIAFTGYPVTDMKRAKAFYEGVLGLKRSRNLGGKDDEDAKWVEYDIGAGCLALISSAPDQWPPHPAGATVALEVDDFDGYVKKLREAGVKFVWEPQESPMCWMTVVADPDGSWVVIHHRK